MIIFFIDLIVLYQYNTRHSIYKNRLQTQLPHDILVGQYCSDGKQQVFAPERINDNSPHEW